MSLLRVREFPAHCLQRREEEVTQFSAGRDTPTKGVEQAEKRGLGEVK